MSKKLKVLYLDDDENNLISFNAYFRKTYKVYITTNPLEAFNMLQNIQMQIIVSDQRMPEISGIEFLEKTIEIAPDSIRLLITGYTELDMVIEAINRGQVHKYVQKPWDWDKLELILENCVDLYKGRVQLKHKNLELQKTNDELNRFIYSASHDLRSPLMSILGIVQLAKMEKTTNNYFEIIEKSVLKLDKYINSIISYYQNSRSEENFDTIDFKSLIIEVTDLLKGEDKTVNIDYLVNQDGPFVGDLFRLRLILSNIISNAIKYKKNSSELHSVNIAIASNSQSVQISIKDNGIGIHADHLDSIFKMFFRAQISNNKQGSGIGLFIVKESLAKIGGSIKVSSVQDVGTTFEIKIPNKLLNK